MRQILRQYYVKINKIHEYRRWKWNQTLRRKIDVECITSAFVASEHQIFGEDGRLFLAYRKILHFTRTHNITRKLFVQYQ
jgi:GTP cyclohydrolase III